MILVWSLSTEVAGLHGEVDDQRVRLLLRYLRQLFPQCGPHGKIQLAVQPDHGGSIGHIHINRKRASAIKAGQRGSERVSSMRITACRRAASMRRSFSRLLLEIKVQWRAAGRGLRDQRPALQEDLARRPAPRSGH